MPIRVSLFERAVRLSVKSFPVALASEICSNRADAAIRTELESALSSGKPAPSAVFRALDGVE